MGLTRRDVLAGAAAGVLGASGLYELVDSLAEAAPARAATAARGQEQHLLDLRATTENGVVVLVPPLHSEVITARVAVHRADLRDARRTLEAVLAELEREHVATAAGLGVTVAWGLPYFRRLVPAAAKRHIPYDRRAQKPALLDARVFPSDPAGIVREANDVAILLRSDVRAHVDDAAARILATKTLAVTSRRRGFVGGGLPRKLALAAGIGGADLIPAHAQLFLGFTSTQRDALGHGRIANLETLGYADVRGGYFAHGTHMHLSHIVEDVEAWYLNFAYPERVSTAFRPGLQTKTGTLTVPQGPADTSDAATVAATFRQTGAIGHSAAIQTASRLQQDVVGSDGVVYAKGSAVPMRADFNTLDNPFVDAGPPVAAVHFVSFNPTSDDFDRTRLAMDGILPDGTKLPFVPLSRGQGFNSILTTTRRQNFLVPPRSHRSFPLAEL